MTLALEFDLPFGRFNLAKNFWTVSAGVNSFHMNSLWQSFSGGTNIFTLWQPRKLTYFLKTLTLLITFEQWVLELWYFIWIFYETRPSRGHQQFQPYMYDLYLGAWPTFWKFLALLRTFELWVLEFIHFTWIFLVRPELHIQDLTEAGPAGRNRFPPHVHSNLGTFQTSKQWEQGSTAGTLLNFKKKFKYTLLNKFGPSFRKLVDFLLQFIVVMSLISREDVVKEIHCLSIYFLWCWNISHSNKTNY